MFIFDLFVENDFPNGKKSKGGTLTEFFTNVHPECGLDLDRNATATASVAVAVSATAVRTLTFTLSFTSITV